MIFSKKYVGLIGNTALIVLLLTTLRVTASDSTTLFQIASPNKSLKLTVSALNNQQLVYSVKKNNVQIITNSQLGLLVDSVNLGYGAKLSAPPKITAINESYTLMGGHPLASNNANELELPLSVGDKKFIIFIRLYNDGYGIRYGLPKGAKRINADLTNWNFADTTGKVAWSDISTGYEGLSRVTPWKKIPFNKTIMPPVTIESNGCWISVSEADCETFSDMALQKDINGLKAVFPVANQGWNIQLLAENGANVLKGTYKGMLVSPWRTAIIATSMTELVNADLLTNLSPAPAKGINFSWVKPGRCLWQWWSVGAPKFEEQKDWFNAAAKLKWEYYLIDDGWRTWKKEGKDQWQLLAEAIAYGKSVGVKSIVWVDSKEMRFAKERRTYLEKIKALGADGIKIDFIPKATADIMQWYMGSMQDCAELQLLLNFHGSVKPTGLSRTYPNDITREAVRGNEYHMSRYNRVQPLNHDVSLPFTRLLAGAADVTPVMLNPKELASAKYTWAHQFAQAIVYLSPITHFADEYRFYLESPMFDLFQQIPTVWDETRVLPCTKMGEVAAFARRKGSVWWIGVLNGEAQTEVTIATDFLQTNTTASLIFDTQNGFAEINRQEKKISKGEQITIKMSVGGGFVGKFVPLK